jgi:predicted nucleotide-binding protein
VKNSNELIEEIISQAEGIDFRNGQLDIVKKRAEMMIRKLFGDKSHYIKSLNSIRYSPMIWSTETSDSVFIRSFNGGKQNLLNLLNVIKEDISLNLKLHNETKSSKTESCDNSNVFIVHGYNEEMKQSVARMIEKLDLNPIILHEQANIGKTIIEKFTDNSDGLFAIVILSADDIAYLRTDSLGNAKFRPRQNVIFELGYFMGKLGRERVLALHQIIDNFEIPSDYSGVIFVPYDENGKWKFELVKELKAIGVDVDANKII